MANRLTRNTVAEKPAQRAYRRIGHRFDRLLMFRLGPVGRLNMTGLAVPTDL